MSSRSRHKSAISLTLDNDVLDFFSGKNRSGRINHILRLYLRSRLGDEDSRFDEKTDRQIFAPAIMICQKQFGDRDVVTQIIKSIFEVIE